MAIFNLKKLNVVKTAKKYSVELILAAILVALYQTRALHKSQFVHSMTGRVVMIATALMVTYLRGPIAGATIALVGVMMMHKVYEGFEDADEDEDEDEEEEFEEHEEPKDHFDVEKEEEETPEGFEEKKCDGPECEGFTEKKEVEAYEDKEAFTGCPYKKE